jgi:hypothetical protein
MAEHLNQKAEPPLDFFNMMGKPISTNVRQGAYDVCRKSFGLDSARSWEAVNTTAEQLERDRPQTALGMAMKHVDLTGAYRLMATLLAGVANEQQEGK